MAPRDTQFAQETVAASLGLTAEDLGVSVDDGDGMPDFGDGLDAEDSLEGDIGDDGQTFDGSSRQNGPDMGETQRPPRRARDQFGREPKKARDQQQQQQPFKLSAEVRPDQRGNLVDRNGNVVARAGKEARLYQQAANANRSLQTFQAQARTQVQDLHSRLTRAVEIGRELHARVEQMQAAQGEIRKLGLTSQEQLEAMQLVAMGKTNPVGALKMILTRAAANGIDLSQVVSGLSGGGDLKSLADMLRTEIKQEMQPIRERTERETRQEQQRLAERRSFDDAKSQVSQFFVQNPDAKQYIPVFDAVLQQHPQMTLREIWAELRLHLASRRPMQNGARTRNRGAFPNGRGRTPPAARGEMAPVKDSYESIARSILDEAGIR